MPDTARRPTVVVASVWRLRVGVRFVTITGLASYDDAIDLVDRLTLRGYAFNAYRRLPSGWAVCMARPAQSLS